MDVSDFVNMVDGLDQIDEVNMSWDVNRISEDFMNPDDFSESQFDKLVLDLFVRSNAGTFAYSLSDLYFGGEKIEGSITLTVTDAGISFTGILDWLQEVYKAIDDSNNLLSDATAVRHFVDPEKKAWIIRTIKLMFWKSFPKSLVTD